MMTDFSSHRAKAIRPSATFVLSTKAKELKALGKPILDLTLGEPDLPTPAPVVEAAHRALEEGHFGYTPTAGVPALRKAIAEVYTKRLRIEVDPSMTMATQGGKQGLFSALATVTDPGDKIAVLEPYWVSYLEQAHALGLQTVVIPCPAENRYRPDLDALRDALAQGVKVLILNSPCNPSGAAYDRQEMTAIADLVLSSDSLLVSDEIYEDIVYAPEGHVSPLHVRPELKDRCCVVTGLSKGFAMTGWRIGFSIAGKWWTDAMIRLQGHTTSHIAAMCQQAAITALRRRDLIASLVEVFARRRERILPLVDGLNGVSVLPPEGAFYLFLDFRAVLRGDGPAQSSASLAGWLLEKHLIALVPGEAFGTAGHLRLSFAASDAVLDETFDRLGFAMSQL